ncbi:hypothetical protein BaRGS_00010409, partial [Batillaria attramentaria]
MYVTVKGIDCFKCTSVNHNEPRCEDPFNNTAPDLFYKPGCLATRRGRTGLFPSHRCIKMKTWNATYSVVVRDCIGVETNPFGRLVGQITCTMSSVVWLGRVMKGCILTCDED